jgi:hypothetical protein
MTNNKRKHIDCDPIEYKCELCGYKTTRPFLWKQHITTKKHKFHYPNEINEINEIQQKPQKQTQPKKQSCSIKTKTKMNIEAQPTFPDKILMHIEHTQFTQLHLTETEQNQLLHKKQCVCGKIFSYRQGLHRHKKSCVSYQEYLIQQEQEKNNNDIQNNTTDITIINGLEQCESSNPDTLTSHHEQEDGINYKELLLKILDENKNLQDLLIKQQQEFMKQQTDLIQSIRPTIQHNHINSNNIFNIQMFLNTECNRAMTIQDFANTLNVSLEDVEKNKYECLTNVLLKNLKPLSITTRPVHCANIKKKEWFIHDKEQGWEKDNGEKLIKQTEFGISKKATIEFNKHYPNWIETDRLKDKFIKLIDMTSGELPEKTKTRLLNEIADDIKLTNEIIPA